MSAPAPAPAPQGGAAPMVGGVPAVQLNEWKHGLFSCMDQPGICLFTCFCPCVQYGKSVEMFEGGSCPVNGCLYLVGLYFFAQCLCHSPIRTRLRTKYGLREVCVSDCVTTWCCPACALCQEAMELQERGATGINPTGAPGAQAMPPQ